MEKRILLVEDNVDLSGVYKETLEEGGYIVTTAYTGTSALQQAERGKYDLILLDMMLPGINGISVLKQVRKLRIHQKTLIYMLTVLDQKTLMKQAQQAGANGYLVKFDYTPDKILEAVEMIFEGEQGTQSE